MSVGRTSHAFTTHTPAARNAEQQQDPLPLNPSVLCRHAQKSLPRSAHFASPISERVKRQRTHKPKPPPPAQDPAAKQAGGKCKQFVQGPASRRLHLKPEVLAMGGGGNVVGGRGVTPSSEDSTTSTAALLASTLPMQVGPFLKSLLYCRILQSLSAS